MKNTSVFALFVLMLVACGGGSELAGEWELLDPTTSSPSGEVMSLSDDKTWSRNGTPSYEGTYSWKEGSLSLHVTKINGESREAAATTAVSAGQPREEVDERLKELDAQMKFELTSEDGAALLKQLNPPKNGPPLVFRRREES